VKIVLDTNVLISAIFWGGKPMEIFTHLLDERISAYATTEIMKEYFRLIEKIGKGKDGFINTWKMKLLDIINIIESTISVSDCRDPKDNMFLECAIVAQAKIIVSGDNDLLTLHPYRGIEILNVNEFLFKLV
jgi:uncharacterized protein